MHSLITAATDPAAYRVAHLLSNKSIFFGSEIPLPSFNKLKYLQIPSAESPSFSHELLKICLYNDIIEVFPLKESEVLELISAKILFEEFGIKIIIPKNNFINSKLLKYQESLPHLSIVLDGKLIAGDVFHDQDLIKELENGVYSWGMEKTELKLKLFTV